MWWNDEKERGECLMFSEFKVISRDAALPRPSNVVRDAINRIRTIQYVIPMKIGIFANGQRCRNKFCTTIALFR